MLTEWISVQVGAGATNQNVFANSRYATLSRPALVSYYAVQDGATAQDDAQIEISHGNAIVRDLSPIPAFTAGEGPERNKHLIAQAGADINDRIVVKCVNNGAAASNFRIIVQLDF